MKVLCISEVTKSSFPKQPIVRPGQIYTVMNSGPRSDLKDGGYIYDWYELQEDPGYMYAQLLFAPLSSIDEREFIRDYNTEKV